ncbi:hypothetical protein C8035_v006670 [Colletotrichum spinosum]|uniref:Uncharacterized protein n=1 Tax=Colletotrichum spinosum TaxID=1347390 RepID=A0A4R8PYK7_9PEZI|nr:hypothetical protein C8035_v006670 [Colletotrichum spinosum]
MQLALVHEQRRDLGYAAPAARATRGFKTAVRSGAWRRSGRDRRGWELLLKSPEATVGRDGRQEKRAAAAHGWGEDPAHFRLPAWAALKPSSIL